MTTVKEDQCLTVTKNRREQNQVIKKEKRSNFAKRAAHIINRIVSYDNNISAVANLLSSTNTTYEYTDFILQAILSLYYDTLKDDFIHMSGKIRDLNDLKEKIVALEIESIWGKDIIKEGARKIAQLREGGQGWSMGGDILSYPASYVFS